jgi:hypothetical protein
MSVRRHDQTSGRAFHLARLMRDGSGRGFPLESRTHFISSPIKKHGDDAARVQGHGRRFRAHAEERRRHCSNAARVVGAEATPMASVAWLLLPRRGRAAALRRDTACSAPATDRRWMAGRRPHLPGTGCRKGASLRTRVAADEPEKPPRRGGAPASHEKPAEAACLQHRGWTVFQVPTGWTSTPWASFNRRMVDVRTRSAAYLS